MGTRGMRLIEWLPGVFTCGVPKSWATFSDDEAYRYVLGRRWDRSKPFLICCLLNPSTADEQTLDPTLRKVKGFAERDGFGGFIVINVYAYRATNPRAMLRHGDPGKHNRSVIEALVRWASYQDRFVAGWGRPLTKAVEREADRVAAQIHTHRDLWRFGDLTKGGHPRHPLYLRKDTPILLWRRRQSY